MDVGLGLAFDGFGQELNVERGVAGRNDLIDARVDLFGVHHLRLALHMADASVKVPEIEARGQGFFGLASHILFDIVFDALQESIRVFALDVELVYFLHPLY